MCHEVPPSLIVTNRRARSLLNNEPRRVLHALNGNAFEHVDRTVSQEPDGARYELLELELLNHVLGQVSSDEIAPLREAETRSVRSGDHDRLAVHDDVSFAFASCHIEKATICGINAVEFLGRIRRFSWGAFASLHCLEESHSSDLVIDCNSKMSDNIVAHAKEDIGFAAS